MKAAVLRRPGDPLEVVEVELRGPGPGEVRVRIEAAGVCHSDLHYLTGDLPCKLPIVPGHEGTGTVIEIGVGVTDVQLGDRVIFTWRPSCGSCEYCTTGTPALCPLGTTHAESNGLIRGGTRLTHAGADVHHLMGVSCFAEEAIVSAESLIAIPKDIPTSIAAIMGCAIITGVGTVINGMGGAAGESVLIIGAGGVGLSAVMGAAAIGAHPIVVADIDDAKLALATELGATHVINTREESLSEHLEQIVPGGVHWSIEAIGRVDTSRDAVDALRPRGTAFLIGLGSSNSEIQLPLNKLVQQEKTVRGSLYGSSNIRVQIPQLLALYTAGHLPLETLLGPEFNLEQINTAFDSLKAGLVGRAVIRMDQSLEAEEVTRGAHKRQDPKNLEVVASGISHMRGV